MLFKAFAATLMLAAIAGGPVLAATPKTATVHISMFAFSPKPLVVALGTTVTWVNDDEEAHSVVSDTRVFHSAAMDTKDHYSFTFTAAGEFPYHCGLHPNMVAKVTVRP
jgi:plastocyanin